MSGTDRPRRLAAAGLLLLLVAAGRAQAEEIELAPLTVSTSRPNVLQGMAAVTVVEPEEEDLRAGRTVADLLATVPGIQIIRSGSSGQAQGITMRGAGSRQVAVLVEGIPAASPAGAATDLSQLPLSSVERIEVYRGGRGAVAGSGALGGAVVIRLKRGRKSEQVERVGASSFGRAGVDGLSGGWGWRSGGMLLQYDHSHGSGRFPFVDTNGNARVRENNRHGADHLTAAWQRRLAGRTRLELLADVNLISRGSPGLEQFPDPAAVEQSAVALAGATVSTDSWPHSSLSSSVGFSHGSWSWRYATPRSALGPAADSHSLSQRSRLALDCRWNPQHWLTARGEVVTTGEWTVRESQRQESLARDRLLVEATVLATAGRERWPLEVAGAVRLAANGSRLPVAVPTLELGWRPWPILHASLTGGRSFRFPAFDELFFEASGVTGNPDLEPEDSWEVGAGIKLELPYLAAEATVFRQWIADTILFLPVSPYLMKAANSGEVAALGLELGFSARWRQLSTGAWLAWIDARFADGGTELPFKSPWSAGGEVKGRWWRLTGVLSANWRSAFLLDRFGSREEEGRILVDCGLRVDLGAGLALSLDARNLLNKRDMLDALQYPLPGISWHLGLEHRREEQSK